MRDDKNVKLKIEEIKKIPQFTNLNEEDIESLIEIIWQYSAIVYKAYNNIKPLILHE